MAQRRVAALVMCFPPIPQPHVRRTGDEVPVKWTVCRGHWMVSEADAIAMMRGSLTPDCSGEDHRVCYRCPEKKNIILHNGTLETRRCTVCCRKNRLRQHQTCKFTCEARFDAMIQCDNRNRLEVNTDAYVDRYIRALCKGAMRVGLSCSKLESEAVLSMARELIQIGIDAEAASARVPRHVNAASIAIDYSRATWESEIRRQAQRETEILVKEYQTIQFVNLKIDAGSVLNAHITHALVDSPWGNAVPLILQVTENERWDCSNYEEFLVAHIQYLENLEPKLVICSVVHDNLAVQANAVANVLSHWDTVPRILDVPCLNHMVNLIFTQSMKDCSALGALVDNVNKWQSMLRAIGLRVPSVPQTRWLYVVELIRHIVSIKELPDALAANMDSVVDILGHEATQAPSEFLLLLDLLEPLYILSHELERRKTRLADVIPMIQECLASFKRVTEHLPEDCAVGHEIVHCLVSNLIARLRSNAYDEILASYALTLKGKAEVKARLCSKNGPPRCRLSALLELNQAIVEQPHCFQCYMDCVSDDADDIWSSDTCDCACDLADDDDATQRQQNDLTDPVLVRSPTDLTITQKRRRAYMLNREVMQSASLAELLGFDLLDDVLAVTRRCLINHGGLYDEMGITEKYYQVALDEWIMLDMDGIAAQLEAFHGSNLADIDCKLWNHLTRMSKGDGDWKSWEHLSRIALVFVSAAASEAEVERLLSKQKYIQGENVTNISMDGLTARLQLFGDRSIHSVTEEVEHDSSCI